MIQKRTTKGTQKNTIVLLAVMVMLVATVLTACGSNKAAAPSNDAETTKVETAQAEETDPVAPAEAEEVAEVEPTAEPIPEPVVYEGIDMESTLPGLDWIQTFNGVIDEPKMVIFNDETNKKVIVEDGQEVEFINNSDKLAVYFPKERDIVIYRGDNVINLSRQGFNTLEEKDSAMLLGKIDTSDEDGSKVEVEYKIGVDGEDVVLKATLVIKND